ncbi:hypothetical protein AVEN_246370-1 [Araneus ventricosus]|uniref:Uncharacterized protein n=1 Tax=Araneus ventricosus TaxID=182803 RepID=A0A4Y2M4Q5_ARAVE|nr:hypothetical protein AVEN_246370-1 [Araneus ventricosus]
MMLPKSEYSFRGGRIPRELGEQTGRKLFPGSARRTCDHSAVTNEIIRRIEQHFVREHKQFDFNKKRNPNNAAESKHLRERDRAG